MLKVMSIVGTRPELIRLSRVIARFEAVFHHILVHTGQNYDHDLNDIFFRDLDIRRPDHLLGVDTSSLGHMLGETLIRTEEVLVQERPDAVVVLGDTNSSIASLMAKRMKIPVYHMEAGNRCFDENVPEETNRRMIDHIADFNLVYTEHARRNLLAEGLHPRRIVLTGSPLREVLDFYRPRIDASSIVSDLELESGRYFLVSAHREENVDSPSRLRSLLECLEAVVSEWQLPVVVSTHPRTGQRLNNVPALSKPGGVIFHPPFGYFDYCRLQLSAACVLSDSGTVAEESAILGFPAVTLRETIERPEALDAGGLIMTGLDPRSVLEGIAMTLHFAKSDSGTTVPHEYAVTNTSERVCKFLLSTARRHFEWSGIRGR